MLWAHMQDPPPPLTDLCPELPTAADAVLAQAMAKEKDGRFATAREFIDALRSALFYPALRPTSSTRSTGPRR